MSESPTDSPSSSDTMLSIAPQAPQDLQQYHYHHQPHYQAYYPSRSLPVSSASAPPHNSLPMPHRQPLHHELPFPSLLSMGGANAHSNSHHSSKRSQDATIAQALEIARESPDGAQDPTVSKILENALSQIWGRVQAHPESYVMTREEFAVFNFFQHRFTGDKTASLARKRYWDHARA